MLRTIILRIVNIEHAHRYIIFAGTRIRKNSYKKNDIFLVL